MPSETGEPTPPTPQPRAVWTQVTDAPLKGLRLAREAQTLLAWDEADALLLLDAQGHRVAEERMTAGILDAACSDDGTLVALVLAGPRLLLLSGAFEPIAERPLPGDAATLCVDPHGRYVAVATRSERTLLFTRHGRPAGSIETMQPLAHVRFVPATPRLIGASAYGTLFGLSLVPRDEAGNLSAREIWRAQLTANVGRLETTGDGGMVLASCYTLGIQRIDSRGRSEGSYHPGGTAAHAVPDFTGRLIAVATTEGELFLLNRSGAVRWKTGLPRGPVGLEIDPLGRYLVHGLATGEITRVDIEPADTPKREPAAARPAPASNVRTPAWSVPVATTLDQAETAVLCVLDEPPRVAAITSKNQLTVFTTSGGSLGQAPALLGVGRILRPTPGWITAATDRQIVLYDARRNAVQKLDLSLVEVTHLVARPDDYGLALVQEQDRVGRVSLAGRWVWKYELPVAIEELAVGPDGLTALTTADGRLTIHDPAGASIGTYAAQPPEPLLLAAAPGNSPADVRWITLARRTQILRGHNLAGRVIWETPVPWEAWQLHRLETLVVAVAPDGRALAVDGAGRPRVQSRAESPPGPFFESFDERVCRVVRQGEHLQCVDLTGQVRWRYIAREPIGPIAAARIGVAAMIGRSLAWFPEAEAIPGAD